MSSEGLGCLGKGVGRLSFCARLPAAAPRPPLHFFLYICRHVFFCQSHNRGVFPRYTSAGNHGYANRGSYSEYHRSIHPYHPSHPPITSIHTIHLLEFAFKTLQKKRISIPFHLLHPLFLFLCDLFLQYTNSLKQLIN